jgi:protein-tyrosine phosphatase
MLHFLFKKRNTKLNFSNIGIDIHSHLIPGIDDGANSLETASELVKRMREIGFNKIITTPHIMGGHYPNTPQDIFMGLEALKQILRKDSIDIPISAAAEYFLDEDFLGLLDSEKLLTLPNNHLLVEMSLLSPFDGLSDYLFKIQLKGYTTVLAHPERYIYYHNNYEAYEELKEKGVIFQVNIPSLLGYYGKNVKKIAHRLIKDNMVELLGTDIHHMRHINYINENIDTRELQNILSNHEFQNTALFSEISDKKSPISRGF